MATKTLTIILYRGDRQLWDTGPARLVIDAIEPNGFRELVRRPLAQGSTTIQLDLDLHFDAGQRYGIRVEAKRHRTAWYLLRRDTFLRQQGTTMVEVADSFLRLMLVPNKPTSTDAATAYDRLTAAGSPFTNGVSADNYADLTIARQLALLNIEAKLRGTRVVGESLLTYVQSVEYVERDRVYVAMDTNLKHLIEEAPDFTSAPGHDDIPEIPVALPGHPDSWKHTAFEAGNLQLSFADDPSNGAFSVDVDIDLERGFSHVIEWLDNNVFRHGQKTDQTRIYGLLYSQGILPFYTLDPAETL